jgi:hypothetical protein
MLTAFRNPHGFHIVIMYPPRVLLNASWLIDGNLVPVVQKFFLAEKSAGRRKLVVDIENAPARNSRMIQNFFGYDPLKKVAHPIYFPNISPSDFYLFGKAKNALIRREILDEIDLFEVATETLNGISDAELQYVFRS